METGSMAEAELLREKRRIRARMLKIRDALPVSFKEAAQKAITETLTGLLAYTRAGIILCYASFQSEVATKALMLQALSDGKALYCPKVFPHKSFSEKSVPHMEFYRIFSLEDLQPGHYGIREPKPLPGRQFLFSGGNTRECADILAVMPGVAFDAARHRLGYGGGFYDAYMGRFHNSGIKSSVTAAALAFSVQVTAHIPAGACDFIPQMIITERGIL